MRNILLTACFLFVISQAFSGVNEEVKVTLSKSVQPVFIKKVENRLLQIEVNNTTGKEITVKSITLSSKGTSDLQDIETARVYFTGTSEEFAPQVLFGKTSASSQSMVFTGEQSLRPGNNYFWAAVHVSPQTNLRHKINLDCQSIEIAGYTAKIERKTAIAPSGTGYAVRQRMDDSVNAYRIPGLAKTAKGTLLAVYDIRHDNAGDLQGDIDVGVSRSLDNGQTWLPMQRAIDMGPWGGKSEKENGIGDPAILVDNNTGRIWVAALWLHGNDNKRAWWASKQGLTPEETGQFILAYSDDEGASWSEPINITGQVKNPEWYLCFNGPGMGITKKDGTLVFPAQFKDKDQIPHSTLIYSKDHGKSWHMGTGAKSKTTEAQVVELSDGTLMLNMRDDRGGSRSVYTTTDLGQTWTEHPTSRKALQEPVCQASIIRIHLKDGREALAFFNPDSNKERSHLSLKLSFDEGMTWDTKYTTLVYEPGSYGYSCLTQLDDSTLGVLYEGAGDLFYQQVDLNEILK